MGAGGEQPALVWGQPTSARGSAAAGAAVLTMLCGRLSGVILVSIVQNKDKKPFFPFSLWGEIIVHQPRHAEHESYMITVRF